MAVTRPARALPQPALLALLLAACGGGGGEDGGNQVPVPSLFVDIAATSLPGNISDMSCMDSVALDYDSDGDLDLALALEFHRNAILRNDGSGRFSDASTAAGMLGHPDDHEGMTAADLDGDGDLDLVFAAEDTALHEVYIDQGASFVGRRLADSSVANDVIAFDVDGDADLDLLFGGQGLMLLINDGSGGFARDLTGRVPPPGGVVQALEAVDLDADGDLDLALGIEGQNQLLRNDGSGRFADVTATTLPAVDDETRVMAFADVDADGDLDLFVGNVLQELPAPVTQDFLYLNDGSGTFSAAPPGRLPAVFSTYGGGFVDYDADGDPDLLLTNANLLHGTDMPGALLYRNDGTGAFTDISAAAFGSQAREHFMGMASGDFDRDGRLDLFLCARGTTSGGRWIGFADHLMRQQ